jgi:hypothetical protein
VEKAPRSMRAQRWPCAISNGTQRSTGRLTQISRSDRTTALYWAPYKLVILLPAPSRIRDSPPRTYPTTYQARRPPFSTTLLPSPHAAPLRRADQGEETAQHDEAHHRAPVSVADALGMSGKKQRAKAYQIPLGDHRDQTLDPPDGDRPFCHLAHLPSRISPSGSGRGAAARSRKGGTLRRHYDCAPNNAGYQGRKVGTQGAKAPNLSQGPETYRPSGSPRDLTLKCQELAEHRTAGEYSNSNVQH